MDEIAKLRKLINLKKQLTQVDFDDLIRQLKGIANLYNTCKKIIGDDKE